jgi:hypothetical protein
MFEKINRSRNDAELGSIEHFPAPESGGVPPKTLGEYFRDTSDPKPGNASQAMQGRQCKPDAAIRCNR